MRHVLAALALAFALPAAAQTPPDSVAWQRFFPLNVGDEWWYGYHRTYCPAHSVCQPTTYWVERWVMTGYTVHEGYEYGIMSNGANHCMVRVMMEGNDSDGRVWTATGDSNCIFYGSYPRVSAQPVNPVVIELASVPVEVDALIGSLDPVSGSAYAADIGMVANRYLDTGCCGYRVDHRRRLVYARVGGIVYGNPHVAVEGAAPPSGLSVTVLPNPVRGAATVSLHLGSTGAARVEVLDLLGRVVLTRDLGTQPAGASVHVLDSAALAPGVYVVRVTTPDGVVTHRFVRAD